MTAIVTEAGLNENIEILLGLPGKIQAGVQTSVNHEVICSHGDGQEFITDDSDIIIIRDENGRDVTDYYWWARPGKYTVTVASFMVCPAIGPEKAPRDLTYLTNPPPVSGLKSYDYDKLRAALDANPPSSIIAEDKSFTHRSSPFNAKVINLTLDANSAVTNFTAYERLLSDDAPTNLKVLNFEANPNAVPTNTKVIDLFIESGPADLSAIRELPLALENLRATQILEVGPTGLNYTVPPAVGPEGLSSANVLLQDGAPTSLQVVASPSETVTSLESTTPPNANSSPTGLQTSSISPYANEAPTGLQTSSISPYANEAPTGLSYLADMDEDGVYSDVDLDDNNPSVGLLAPPASNQKPSNLQVSDVDMDGDGVYASTDYDDNDPSVQTAPEWGIGLTRIAFTAPMFPDTSIDGGSTWIIGNPNLIGTTKTTYGNPILLRANPETYTSLASFSSGRPTWYFQGWTKATAGNESNEISYDPYDPNTEVTHNIGYGNGYGSLVANFQTDKTPIFVYYTKFQMSNKIVSSDTATLETAEGSVQILPYMHPGYQYLNSNPPISESSQTPGATGYTGKDSWVTLTVPTSISSTTGSNQGTFTFHSLYNASNSGSWVANETKNGNSVKFTAAFASMNAPIVYFARYQ